MGQNEFMEDPNSRKRKGAAENRPVDPVSSASPQPQAFATPDNLTFVDLNPPLSDFERDVVNGLTATPKRIPPKYFYDRRGSELYEKITALDAYYPTRTEIEILEANATDIRRLVGAGATLIEFGCGSSRKIRVLLAALERLKAYVPIDISRDFLFAEVRALAADFAEVPIVAVCGDYTRSLQLDSVLGGGDHGRKVVFFPGSTIGNLTPEERDRLLEFAALVVGPGGGLLIGVDLKKDPAVLERAYDDVDGVTAAFNRNVLHRINRQLGAAIPVENFRHRSHYNRNEGRVEMHLECRAATTVTVAGRSVSFDKGETIHTENSYKFGVKEFQSIADRAGFDAAACWLDREGLFSVHFLVAKRAPGSVEGWLT